MLSLIFGFWVNIRCSGVYLGLRGRVQSELGRLYNE